MKRVRVAVLASGGGTTFENLVRRSRKGRVAAEIVSLVVSRAGAAAIEKAHVVGVPCTVLPWSRERGDAYSDDLTSAVEAAGAELVCLGGFLRLWRFPARWAGRVMNIHPALLPAFGGPGMYGHHVHEAVLASGVKVSGCTVHFASTEYDRGPIIVQRTVPVRFEDTADDLAARVFAEECEAYPEAIDLYAQDRLRIVGDRVQVLPPP